MSDHLPLTSQARAEALDIITTLDDNLKGIASRLASDADAGIVTPPYIREAYRTLRRNGLAPPPARFWHRSEFLIGAGMCLVGLSPSIGGFAYSVAAASSAPGKDAMDSHPVGFWSFVIVVPVLAAIAGCVLTVIGCHKNHQ